MVTAFDYRKFLGLGEWLDVSLGGDPTGVSTLGLFDQSLTLEMPMFGTRLSTLDDRWWPPSRCLFASRSRQRWTA